MFMFKSDKMLLTVQKEVNIIYLYGKKYIYACKMKGVSPTAKHFKNYINRCFEGIGNVKYEEYSKVLSFIDTIEVC